MNIGDLRDKRVLTIDCDVSTELLYYELKKSGSYENDEEFLKELLSTERLKQKENGIGDDPEIEVIGGTILTTPFHPDPEVAEPESQDLELHFSIEENVESAPVEIEPESDAGGHFEEQHDVVLKKEVVRAASPHIDHIEGFDEEDTSSSDSGADNDAEECLGTDGGPRASPTPTIPHEMATSGTSMIDNSRWKDCPICHDRYHAAYFNQHVTSHSAGLPFVCRVCGVSFAKKTGLRVHCMHKHKRVINVKKGYVGSPLNLPKPSLQVDLLDIRSEDLNKIGLSQLDDVTYVVNGSTAKRSATDSTSGRFKCRFCDFNFSRLTPRSVHEVKCKRKREMRKRGKMAASVASRHQCPKCAKCYNSSDTFRKHLQLHVQSKTFKCDQCDILCFSAQGLEYHVTNSLCFRKRIGDRGLKTCKRCQKCFISLKMLVQHRKMHRCGNTASRKQPIRAKASSAVVVSGTKFDQTLAENKDFDQSQAPKLDNELADVRLQCRGCSNVFKSMSSVYNHFKGCVLCKVKGWPFKDSYRQIDCNRSKGMNVSGSGLAKVPHRNGTAEFQCILCNELFKKIKDGRLHVATVHVPMNYKCAFCKLVYSTKFSYMRHCKGSRCRHLDRKIVKPTMAAPTTTTDFEQVKFKNLQELSRGTRNDKSMYRCKVCDQECVGWVSARNHAYKHGGRPFFRCLVCQASYSRKDTIIRHCTRFHCRTLNSDVGVRYEIVTPMKRGRGRPRKKGKHAPSFTSERPDAESKQVVIEVPNAKSFGRIFVCPVCGLKYGHSADVRTHLEKHYAKHDHECQYCGVTFENSGRLSTHQEYKHKDLKVLVIDSKLSLQEAYGMIGSVPKSNRCTEESKRPKPLCKKNRDLRTDSSMGQVQQSLLTDQQPLPDQASPLPDIICDGWYGSYPSVKTGQQSQKASTPIASSTGNQPTISKHGWMKAFGFGYPYTCDPCGCKFQTKEKLREHQENQHPNEVHSNLLPVKGESSKSCE